MAARRLTAREQEPHRYEYKAQNLAAPVSHYSGPQRQFGQGSTRKTVLFTSPCDTVH